MPANDGDVHESINALLSASSDFKQSRISFNILLPFDKKKLLSIEDPVLSLQDLESARIFLC